MILPVASFPLHFSAITAAQSGETQSTVSGFISADGMRTGQDHVRAVPVQFHGMGCRQQMWSRTTCIPRMAPALYTTLTPTALQGGMPAFSGLKKVEYIIHSQSQRKY